MYRHHCIAALAACALSATVLAQDATRLTKPEVEALTAGRELKYTRATDGTPIVWDFRKDGSVYYTPQNTRRAIVIGGSYTIDDDAGLCIKWREDKYVTMTDACYVFVRTGDTTRIASKRNPDRVFGELVP